MPLIVWPFLVSRNPLIDYRAIVAPGEIAGHPVKTWLTDAVGDAMVGSSVFYREIELPDPTAMALALIFCVKPATQADLGDQGTEVLRDRPQGGRQIRLIKGIVVLGQRSQLDALLNQQRLNQTQFARFLDPLQGYYRQFWSRVTPPPPIPAAAVEWDLTTESPLVAPLLTLKPMETFKVPVAGDRTQGVPSPVLLNLQSTDAVVLSPLASSTLPIQTVAFSPDGQLLVSRHSNQGVTVWDGVANAPIDQIHGASPLPSMLYEPLQTLWRDPLSFEHGQSVAFSPHLKHPLIAIARHDLDTIFDSRNVAKLLNSKVIDNLQTGRVQPHGIKLWDVRQRRLVRLLIGHTHKITALAFSPDGSMLVSGSQDTLLKTWNPQTGQALRTLSGHRAPIQAIAMSPKGNVLASADQSGTIQFWHLRTGRPQDGLQEQTTPINTIAFSPDGRLFASGSNDGTIKIWNRRTGKVANTLTEHQQPVTSLAFSPIKRQGLLASASLDGTVKLWGPAMGAQSHCTLRGHRAPVTTVTFSPTGQILASGSHDKTIRLWPVGHDV